MGSNILPEFCRSRVLGSHPMVRSISTASASTKVVVASQTPARDSQTGAYCASALPRPAPPTVNKLNIFLVIRKPGECWGTLESGIGLKLNMPKAETSQLTLSDNQCRLELFREIPNRTSYYASRSQVEAQGYRPGGTPGFGRRTRPPTK